MFQIAYTPQWFYSKDIYIDSISLFVLLLIASFSIRCYRIDKKNKNYLYLAISFFLIAISFASKILTNFTIYTHILETQTYGLFTLTYRTIKTSDVLFFVGFLFYRVFMLLGLYALYSVYQRSQSRSAIFLMSFFIVASTYFSRNSYYLFHFTAFLFLSLIVWYFYNTYKKNRQKATKILAVSFGIIGLSQVSSMFAGLTTVLYVVAEIMQLIGYLVLLYTFFKVLRNAKKKKQA